MERENWVHWVEKLHTWRLHRLTAAIMEGLGPLHVLGAQLLYLSQPILNTFIPSQSTMDLADLLEDPESAGRFVNALRTYDAT